jgi:hypothetical protein
MPLPLFSVVIPTKDRAHTLQHSLRTCLAQDFDDFEIVISDNCGAPTTREVVEAAGSAKIRYSRSDIPLCMSDNYERAVAAASGDYVIVCGDDDGLMPYALRELAGLVNRYSNPAAIQWRRGLYTWPTIAVPEESNFMSFSTDWDHAEVDGRAKLQSASRFEIDSDQLPMINTSAIRRDIIDRHRAIAGRVFVNAHPDVYTGFAFAYLAGRFVSVAAPMSIAGLSGSSTGVAVLLQSDRNAIARGFYDQSKQAGLLPHPRVPLVHDIPVHSADSFHWAKHFLFPDDVGLEMNRKDMIERFLGSNPNTDEGARADARAAIRLTLEDSPGLLAWFDANASSFKASKRPRLRPERFGIDPNGHCTVDTSLFGVHDISGAVRLASNLLAYESGIPFDSPSFAATIRWHRQDSERRTLESFAGAQASAADRC